ncbi:FAD-dependent oxidoreductase [uncultured Dysosmobacter sp.]|uniref:FAD-dependent oxidoreductase n=1 Tax=uncultured Dysosmobacter sp. TaxID=2591384 RepID=UPI00260597E0|nr:FAD-dependent oxidoreductase [uncultured Dysosmobacter sp.]
MTSIWAETVDLPSFPTLKGNVETEVAVIGGGLAGILTADALRREGVKVLVLEADRLGSGQTGGTTAKLTAQHGLKYHQLIQDLGMAAAAQYAWANLGAVRRLRKLVEERHICCDLEDCTSFLYTTGAPGLLQEEFDACQALQMDVFLTGDTELPFAVQALGLRDQARFHPLKLLAALAEDLTIYEHSRVLTVEGRDIATDQGRVTAERIVFACHYPFINAPGYYFARQHQERSYVLALRGAAALRDCYLGIDENGLSFRSWNVYLLLGGGGHRTGENRQGGKYDLLRQAARRFWPGCQTAAAWSAQDCIPMDGVPYIGLYSGSRPDWLVATGFQKWGMTSSVLASEILCDLALGRTPMADSAVFSPQRFHATASAKQLAKDTAHAVRGLGRRVLEPGRIPAEALPEGHGGVVEVDGEKLGVYRAEDGQVYAVPVKCPHLGCQLEWNPDEKSWDCPCHGSRFDYQGRLLEGPAQTDL